MSMYDRDWYRERKIDYENGGLIPSNKRSSKFNSVRNFFSWKAMGIVGVVVAVIFFLYSANL